ncbi:hypothetical protein CYMTET_20456 [Cymbomonas tetramitiformis]|uniref:Uncharacterized protein n=1 Tax=Cymbomonas tetramitiformis TaxID=36881 RepID=A0AAE0G412_9CHLO|nr:hypothetical protein CYMTET_20456 [Cymbomonas tetramitiformis]
MEKDKALGKEREYHGYMDCPYGGKREHAGSAAAFCIPAGDCEEDAYTLAVCYAIQQASDSGASAFAATLCVSTARQR